MLYGRGVFMVYKDSDTVRVNCRIGATENAWLDAESKRTGISKSSLVQMAVESYIIDRYENESIMQRVAEKLEEQK